MISGENVDDPANVSKVSLQPKCLKFAAFELSKRRS